jgi:hypothetical protein
MGLLVTQPNSSMAMKTLAGGYWQPHTNLLNPDLYIHVHVPALEEMTILALLDLVTEKDDNNSCCALILIYFSLCLVVYFIIFMCLIL